MKKLSALLRFIGVVQILLGLGLLFAPAGFVAWMKLAATAPDANYLFGMLAARFLAYGVGMFYIAHAPKENIFWIQNMLFIQIIDLAAGLFYTATGTLTLASSAFPMFNASLLVILLTLWMPKKTSAAAS